MIEDSFTINKLFMDKKIGPEEEWEKKCMNYKKKI